MSKLECKDFSVKYFGYDDAISGVTTTFSDGINVLFASEKGGKTTFLKAIAGIVEHKGALLIDGEDVGNIPLKKRDFQMLFDDYALFSRHSARYNLEYPLKLRKVPKPERRALVEAAASLFDLELMIDAPVYRLNEWHKVSLVLCRAYLRKAKVLLIDNIFSKLDPQSRKEAFLRYLPLFAEQGIVIYATDDASEAAALSRNVKLFSYGYLLQEGSVSDFRARPACLAAFSAFADYPSFLPGTVEQDGVTIFGKFFPLSGVEPIADSYLGKDVIVGLSLADLVIFPDGFTATVQGRFYLGDGVVYLMGYNGDSFFLLDREERAIGDTITVGVRSVTGLFDRVNERAVMRYKE